MNSTHSVSDHLREENDRLKTTVKSQEDKIKLLATKLVKYLKRGEEERSKIVELENQISGLKEKITVYRTQLESQSQLSSFGRSRSPRVHQNNSNSLESILLEAKAENQALENKIGILKSILVEKDAEIERLQADSAKPPQSDSKKLEENIKLIRLNREKRKASSWLSTLETQCNALQSECNKSKETIAQLEGEVTDWNEKVNELQERNLALEKRLGEVASCRFSGKESESMISSLQCEIKILKKTNEQLTNKLETKRPVAAAVDESELKMQTLELEKRLKAECEKNAELIRQQSVLEKQAPLPPPHPPSPPVTKEIEIQVGMEAFSCVKCEANASDLTQTQYQLVCLRDELLKIRQLLETQTRINRDLMRDVRKD